MENYKELLQKWQDIYTAMSAIEGYNQSQYFLNFKKEVENRIAEYKFLAKRAK